MPVPHTLHTLHTSTTTLTIISTLACACRRLQGTAQSVEASESSSEPVALAQQRHEAEIASMSLAVLVRLTANAGCVEALAEERALLLCYWLVHRPPGPSQLLLALRLLHALAITPPAAWAAAAQAGVVYLLTVLLPAKPPTPAFKVCFHATVAFVMPQLAA